MSQTSARRRSLVLVLGLLASFAVLWITASAGDRAQAQQNTPATGTVTITGTVGIGELLTAHASGITDADGLTNPNFFLLWLAGATSDPTDATGRLFAYEERYHVLPLDAGLRIMVAVSFYDDADNLEVIYSVATGVVATVAPAPPGDLTASSTAPGELSLRWQAPSWGIRDWLDERSNVGNGGSDITGYKVQWKLSTGSWSVPADVSEETAAGETHTITNLTGGQTYTLRVIATNEVGDSEPSREITQAVNRQAQPNTPAAGTVTIRGTVGIGELLTAHASGITDADGLTNPKFLFLWLAGATSDPTDANVRLFAYEERYHVLPLDAGLRIMVAVSFYDDAGNLEVIHSVATGVVATVAPAPPGDLTASSTAPGELSLRWQGPSSSIQDWRDERSNVGNGGSDITGYKVQWKRSTGSWNVPADVSEETAAGEAHTITNLTGGQTYTLRVVATNDVGDSEPSREITQAVQAQLNTPATGTVTITGTVGIGELLTAHASGITDADGLTNPNFFFLWLAGPTSDPTDANIRLFAYKERYHVLPLDAGLRIMVGVSFHDDAGNLEAIHSAATAVVATVAPAPPRNLTASSTAQGELSLRWQGPSWSIQDWLDERSNVGNGGSDITGYKVQWKRSTGSWNVPADVSEETAAAETHTNTITNLTGGQTYTLRVIATNGVGDSQPSREITRAINRFATGAPTITGTPRVGEVLTVDTSSITDEDGLTNPRFSIGWRVVPPQNDILIRLYNRRDYLVRPVDVGRTIQARVSFIDDANFTEALYSTATTEVAASSPDPPRNLTASPVGGSALNLEWEAPSWTLADWVFNGSSAIGNGGSPITSYTVQWKEASGSWTNPSDVSSATVTGMTHAITGLIPGVPYSLRVVATNAIGDSTPSPELTVTARNPPITFVGGGGGGGGGRTGPTPSEVDFEWNVTRDIDALDSANGSPTGLWSDGETLWIAENGDGADDAVYAYDLATGERLEEREFELDERNRAPRGVWSDRAVIWISDSGQEKLFAHDLESGERLPERDIAVAERNRDARGIWSNGETMWVLDGVKDSLFAYDIASGDLLAEYELDAANDDPRGIWSDGVTVWVSNHEPKRLFAYRLPVLPDAETNPGEDDADDDARELERVRNEEFSKLSRAGNNSPRGIWSDGDVMYVADANDDRVYTYNMPDAIDARLASLTLSGVDIGEFDPGRTDYEGAVADGVTETTVEAEAMQPRTDVAIDPPAADGDDANGHPVALQDLGEITVTVTSQDGSRKKTYRVQFPETAWDPARDPWPHCLRGAVSEGFSLIVYEGGSVEELVTCAESRDIVTLYVLHEGVYVSHILGAPGFVNAGFLELFPDGLPPIAPLVATSNGPPSADPFGDLDDGGRQPWPECLRGDIAEGFSLVVYEGGSVEELVVCAESMDVTALYTLSEGEFVSYILGAPDFATQPFRDLFADGLPLMTPLVAKSEGLPGDR